MTGPDLQLTHLRALEAIGRHGTFSRAARELRLTQPAVSMQIRLLERQVGVPLLERVGKRAFPTAAGAVVLEHAARAFRELRAGLDRVQELRGVVAGQVRLGTSAAISVYLLPRALRTFRARYPAIELVVMTGLASDIARLVVANELDLGLVTLPLRDRALAITPFYRDELVAIAARDRAWPRRRSVTAAELAREPMILFDHGSTVRRVIDQWFHRAGVAPRTAMELGNTEAIKKLVEARLGLSVTSEFCVKADVAAGLLAVRRLDPPLFRQIGLVRRRDKALTAPVQAFVAALDQLGRTLSGQRRAPRA